MRCTISERKTDVLCIRSNYNVLFENKKIASAKFTFPLDDFAFGSEK